MDQHMTLTKLGTWKLLALHIGLNSTYALNKDTDFLGQLRLALSLSLSL